MVTISSKATVKQKQSMYIVHDTHFSFHFQDHTLDNSVHTNCDLARVISKISLSTLACIDNSVHTNCDFINSHTCDLAHVTSKISFGALWLTFSRSHIR